jgi:ABC-type transport system substrate-binding protein
VAEEGTDLSIAIAVDGIGGNWDPAVGGAGITEYYPWRRPCRQSMVDDRRSFQVTLPDGISFSDGSPVDAEAVVASYEHILTEDSTWAFKATAEGVGAEFSVTDDLGGTS